MKRPILILSSAAILLTLACSLTQVNIPDNTSGLSPTLDANKSPSAGDPEQGKLLFTGQVDGKFACSNCHSLLPGQTLVGPSLAGIATMAATRMDGYSAEEYLYESIAAPNAYIVEGFHPDIMPENGKQMTEGQMADLIAYLMTLE